MSQQAAQRSSRQSTAPASATTTTTDAPTHPSNGETVRLQLRGADSQNREDRPRRRIRWAEDVVNNEGMGKKSSKVCCIYHKPREVGESSSEDSDSSSSDGDSSDDDGAARPSQRGRRRDHDADCDYGHDQGEKKARKERKPSPNAYEKQPKSVTEKSKPNT